MMTCWQIDPSNRPKFFNLQYDVQQFKLTGDTSGYDTAKFIAKNTFSVRKKRRDSYYKSS